MYKNPRLLVKKNQDVKILYNINLSKRDRIINIQKTPNIYLKILLYFVLLFSSKVASVIKLVHETIISLPPPRVSSPRQGLRTSADEFV